MGRVLSTDSMRSHPISFRFPGARVKDFPIFLRRGTMPTNVYLQTLRITNFRSCADTIITFRETLTILVGANNAGKTNVLEAIRLITTPSDGRRAAYPVQDDVRRDSGASFLIEANFADLNDTQRGAFITALSEPSSMEATFGLAFEKPRGRERRGRQTRTVGRLRGSEAEPEARELIRHVHLPALRDAARELGSSSPDRIESLIKRTSDTSSRDNLIETAKNTLGDLNKHSVIRAAEERIQRGFHDLTVGDQPHRSHLGFAAPTLTALARDLRFRLSLFDHDPAELTESGLGYANLLFLSTVLVELQAASDAELTLFLVEEPEAHLHPQLQTTVLSFLRDQAQESILRQPVLGEPAGRIQVVVTTHSPNLTAAVSARHLVILRSVFSGAGAPTGESTDAVGSGLPQSADAPAAPLDGEGAPPTGLGLPSTRAIAVASLQLDPHVLAKIDRYLDVTRSSLLFARRVLLVEGIAEGLLIPVFAKSLYRTNATLMARVQAATIIPIDGVDFEPYVRLLLTCDPESGARIAEMVVVLTDEDPSAGNSTLNGVHSKSGGMQRRDGLLELAHQLHAATNLHVELTPNTLEAAILGNPPESVAQEALRDAFLAIHPRSSATWEREIELLPGPQRGNNLVRLLQGTSTRKGDFAQELAQQVERREVFPVPASVRNALGMLVGRSNGT